MRTCIGCRYAEWDKTKSGKFHPSGNGKCAFPYKIPPLPIAFYYISAGAPIPSGGYINRKEQHKEHCVYFNNYTEG